MNIQDSVVKVMRVMLEAGTALTSKQITDILAGKETQEMEELEYDQLESFGIGENNDEDEWPNILDRCIQEGFMKEKSTKLCTFVITPAGKKFCKKPHEIVVDEDEDYSGKDDEQIDDVISTTMLEQKGGGDLQNTSERTKRQIKLIKAIDRKIALDDFAESENIDLDEVIDDLNDLKKHGKKMNIMYFITEFIDKDDVKEFQDSFEGRPFTMKEAEKEWGDVYNVQELRLLGFLMS